MIRSAYIISFVLCFACSAGFISAGNKNGELDEIENLKTERVSLLRERVSTYNDFYQRGAISAAEMAPPTIDLISVQIEYEESNAERRKLYDALLKQYDLLIKRAEVVEKAPRVGFRTKGELLRLKAEQIRIKIERA